MPQFAQAGFYLLVMLAGCIMAFSTSSRVKHAGWLIVVAPLFGVATIHPDGGAAIPVFLIVAALFSAGYYYFVASCSAEFKARRITEIQSVEYIRCPKCGRENGSEATICPRCYTRQEAPTEEYVAR